MHASLFNQGIKILLSNNKNVTKHKEKTLSATSKLYLFNHFQKICLPKELRFGRRNCSVQYFDFFMFIIMKPKVDLIFYSKLYSLRRQSDVKTTTLVKYLILKWTPFKFFHLVDSNWWNLFEFISPNARYEHLCGLLFKKNNRLSATN